MKMYFWFGAATLLITLYLPIAQAAGEYTCGTVSKVDSGGRRFKLEMPQGKSKEFVIGLDKFRTLAEPVQQAAQNKSNLCVKIAFRNGVDSLDSIQAKDAPKQEKSEEENSADLSSYSCGMITKVDKGSRRFKILLDQGQSKEFLIGLDQFRNLGTQTQTAASSTNRYCVRISFRNGVDSLDAIRLAPPSQTAEAPRAAGDGAR